MDNGTLLLPNERGPNAIKAAPRRGHVELEPWEVGAELLDILSRGLYSDARDALREYVQNGVDAGASQITITVDGPTVVVRDNGSGMDESELRRARRFGISEKSPKHMVGYRGIGIYAAFGICEQMTILTRRSGMEGLVGWRFLFGEMRKVLESDKQAEKREGLALSNLLQQNTELIPQAFSGDQEEHFTVVRLEGLSDEYRAQLNDASRVNEYLLNTIPVLFPEEGYGPVVNGWLAEHVQLDAVRLLLRIGDEPEFPVQPFVTSAVLDPDYDWIVGKDGSKLAFVWHALSDTGRQIAPTADGTVTSGFLMKLKGFTLGDRQTVKPLWPLVGARTLYHHYTGEIHIQPAANVYPNAARDNLEPSPAKQVFTKLTGDLFDQLNRRANALRSMAHVTKALEGQAQLVESFSARLQRSDEDPFELYREAKNLVADFSEMQRELKRHTSNRPRAPVTLKENQQQRLREIEGLLATTIKNLTDVAQGAQRRTERPEGGGTRPPTRTILPQVALLTRAVEAVRTMASSAPNEILTRAVQATESAARLHVIAAAVGVLDELKASGIELSEAAEAIRKELRASIGWSPTAAVSLQEALTELNVSLETEREEQLIGAVDRGLLVLLGGRGERYEMTLRAVAEALADEFST